MQQAKASEKRIENDERMKASEEMSNNGVDANETVIMPRYCPDPRLKVDKEFGAPAKELYIPLGWDEDSTTKRKHYRQFYNDELENDREVFPQPSPFNSYTLKRGQARGDDDDGLFSFSHKPSTNAEAAPSNEQLVGQFKGLI